MPFFAGSTILMADGSRKLIEDVAYGDYVKDLNGNSSMVDGVRIISAFSRVPKREKFLINDSFLVTDCTTFLSPDYNFYVTGTNPFEVSKTAVFNIETSVFICEKNRLRSLWAWWDESYRSKYHVISNQVVLLKEDGKTETVSRLKEVQDNELHPELDVCYRFSTETGTMWINGYSVISRLTENFDFNTMLPIDGEVSIVFDTDNRKFTRIVNIDHQTNLYGIWDKKNDEWIDHWVFK
ncbi:hypothetical protein UFOVP1071_187 [uncultured Caudovirales phage]|uniref:Uncharacterized protein n=1 Tax=uncultured Caudovirales phage TaxID=2100421 RepID=A0A6J5QLA0_9CAUD|nr:hypothetical protein UFOVP1071_187 [uncultured Caudovirales phage]